jgi:hypothetical protein
MQEMPKFKHEKIDIKELGKLLLSDYAASTKEHDSLQKSIYANAVTLEQLGVAASELGTCKFRLQKATTALATRTLELAESQTLQSETHSKDVAELRLRQEMLQSQKTALELLNDSLQRANTAADRAEARSDQADKSLKLLNKSLQDANTAADRAEARSDQADKTLQETNSVNALMQENIQRLLQQNQHLTGWLHQWSAYGTGSSLAQVSQSYDELLANFTKKTREFEETSLALDKTSLALRKKELDLAVHPDARSLAHATHSRSIAANVAAKLKLPAMRYARKLVRWRAASLAAFEKPTSPHEQEVHRQCENQKSHMQDLKQHVNSQPQNQNSIFTLHTLKFKLSPRNNESVSTYKINIVCTQRSQLFIAVSSTNFPWVFFEI